MGHNYKLVILARSFGKSSDKPLEYLKRSGIEVEIKRNHDVYNENVVAELIGDADAAIVGSDKIGQIVFEKCTNLKIISKHGVGLNNIDIEGARARNIEVTITPGANHESVAELTWLLILAACRDIFNVFKYVKELNWKYPYLGDEVLEKTIGIIGYGRIGQAVARRAVGYNTKMLIYDPVLTEIEPIEGLDIKLASFEEVIKKSDIISLHAPATKETEKIINKDVIQMMKDGVVIVNTSRGELIDEEALYEALVSKKIKMAALDVFSKEPPIESPLLTLDNVIATPHLGTHTKESNMRMGLIAAQNVVENYKKYATI